MARSTNVTAINNDEITSVEAVDKKARRTPAQIAQDDLNLTNEKLEKAQARKTRLEADLERSLDSIKSLEALAAYQRSHPALQSESAPADLAVAEDTQAE